MDGLGAREARGGSSGEIDGSVVDVAAHARNLGEDWRQALDDHDEIDALVDHIVMQRALDLQAERDERLAVMIANNLAKVMPR